MNTDCYDRQSGVQLATSENETHQLWIRRAQPVAQEAISKLWSEEFFAAILWQTPAKLDPKRRKTPALETKKSRLWNFDQFRGKLIGLLNDTDIETARQLVIASEFADAVQIAGSREEAVELFAEFLVKGNNAWADSDLGDHTLSICFWRE